MTGSSGADLGFCQSCGTKRVIANQAHCGTCGTKLVQQAAIIAPPPMPVFAPPPPVPVAPAPVAPVFAPPPPVPVAPAPVAPVPPPVPVFAPQPTVFAPPPAPVAPAPAAPPSQWSSGATTFAPPPPAPPTYQPQTYTPAGYPQAGYPGTSAPAKRNAAIVPVLIAAVLVVALVVVGGAFVFVTSKSSSSSPSSQASIVAVEPARSATPTVLITPKSKGGTLTGKVTSEAGSAESGIGVVLCAMSTLNCITDSHLKAVSSKDGSFEIDNIPAGSYAVFYSTTGAVPASDDNLTINVNDNSAGCIGQALQGGGNVTASCFSSVPFSEDDPNTKVVKNSVVNQAADGTYRLDTGAIYSPLYGLTLNFANGQPLTVAVAAGSATKVSIVVHPSV